MVIIGAIVFGLVAYLSNLEKALAASLVFCVFFTIFSVKLKHGISKTFLIGLLVLAALHIIGLIIIEVPEPKFGLAALPFAFADAFLMWGFLNWLERRLSDR